MKLAQALVILAKQEVGVEEVDGTNRGKRVDEYKAATNLPPHESWPWCAAFICWLVKRAMEAGSDYTFQRPTTAGAWDFERWSKEQDDSTDTRRAPFADRIQAGDIVIFTFSHIGLAVADEKDGVVETVEGNTDSAGSREGGGVFRKSRRISQIRTRIRFTV